MDMPNEFRPRLGDTSLVFEFEGKGNPKDLKRGIRHFLELQHNSGIALLMTQSLNLNCIQSRDRSEMVILVTADSSPLADCVLVDLYVRLLQFNSAIETGLAKYTVSIHGSTDTNKVSILSQHYFWLSSAFKQQEGRGGERHLLN